MLDCDASHLKELAAWTDGWCVSAFLPAHEVEGKQHGDALRLKNLLRDAENELVVLGMRRPEASRLLTGSTPEELNDPASPAFHRAGVALFAAADLHRSYRLVGETPQLVTVAERFHLKPLLAMLDRQRQFAVLAVTRGFARLFVGDPNGLRPVEIPGLPTSLDDAVRYDDREPSLFSHSASRSAGRVVAAFHGQGDRDDYLDEDVLRYLRMVDAAVTPVLDDATPLVLAGSGDVVSLYRGVSHHGALVAHDLPGNPELMALDDVHARAAKLVEGAAQGSLATAVSRFHELDGTGKASGAASTVIPAARHGRVDTMIVASDRQIWGRYPADADAPQMSDTREAGDEDLLDAAAVDAWRAGAQVHVIPREDVPAASGIAAVFRY